MSKIAYKWASMEAPFAVRSSRCAMTPSAQPSVVKAATGQFLDMGIEEAVTPAKKAADGANVVVLGANVARQCLEAGLLGRDHRACRSGPYRRERLRLFESAGVAGTTMCVVVGRTVHSAVYTAGAGVRDPGQIKRQMTGSASGSRSANRTASESAGHKNRSPDL